MWMTAELQTKIQQVEVHGLLQIFVRSYSTCTPGLTLCNDHCAQQQLKEHNLMQFHSYDDIFTSLYYNQLGVDLFISLYRPPY